MTGPDPRRSPATFDPFAATYEADLARGLSLSGEGQDFFARRRIEHLRDVLASSGAVPRRVLDFGCGAGSSTPLFLATLGAESVDGVEESPALRERAGREHGSARARFHAPVDLPEAARFELAFSNGVFHHIAPARRAEAVRYVRDRLAPGGHFALWENNPWNPGTRWVMRRIPFDRDAITLAPPETRRLLAGEGFRIVRTDHLFFFPRFLAWLRPLERGLRAFPLGAQYLTLARKEA